MNSSLKTFLLLFYLNCIETKNKMRTKLIFETLNFCINRIGLFGVHFHMEPTSIIVIFYEIISFQVKMQRRLLKRFLIYVVMSVSKNDSAKIDFSNSLLVIFYLEICSIQVDQVLKITI